MHFRRNANSRRESSGSHRSYSSLGWGMGDLLASRGLAAVNPVIRALLLAQSSVSDSLKSSGGSPESALWYARPSKNGPRRPLLKGIQTRGKTCPTQRDFDFPLCVSILASNAIGFACGP